MQDCFYYRLAKPVGLAVLDIIDISVGEYKSYLISRISVPHAHRRNGLGNALLMRCTDQADLEGATLTLSVAPYGHMSYRQLIRWYKKHGFIKESYSSTMVRAPRKTTVRRRPIMY